jgi:hypothetical protein
MLTQSRYAVRSKADVLTNKAMMHFFNTYTAALRFSLPVDLLFEKVD